ncbi:putative nuclease HARBI1 [Operophtera brumata]|uniref:Putative nuclease HARBI1 n=1 Tax=Operophtera brumata TaxID=104452 RepID=A0A0L7KQP5_OPEBR|nr:putative nuclease HARBI1 [Operophtera brumata]
MFNHILRNCSICPAVQLMVALRFYATGSHLIDVGDIHGIHNSTVSTIVKKVSHAIVGLRRQFIKFPSTAEEITCQRQFYSIAQFPFVIGTIDCTHVKIQAPGGVDAELFRNRKGYFSVNVQTVSDAQNVVARWPGSTHDSAIFTNSTIHHQFESGLYRNSCLLGDSGYPLKLCSKLIKLHQHQLGHHLKK